MEALGHFHYHFWKLERLSYLKCFHRFFTESSQCDLKSQILKHDARFSFCIFWTFYKKKKKQNHNHPLLQWLHDLQQCFLCLHLCLCHKNSFFINFSHWLKRPSCKCCTNNPEYRCQWVFYKTLEKNGTVSKTAEGMSVYTKRPFNTRREEKNLLNIQQNPHQCKQPTTAQQQDPTQSRKSYSKSSIAFMAGTTSRGASGQKCTVKPPETFAIRIGVITHEQAIQLCSYGAGSGNLSQRA